MLNKEDRDLPWLPELIVSTNYFNGRPTLINIKILSFLSVSHLFCDLIFFSKVILSELIIIAKHTHQAGQSLPGL